MTGQQGVATREAQGRDAHPDVVIVAHARVLAGSSAQSRYVEVAGGRRIHAIEVGDGKPLVLLHGSGPTALQFLPLLERLTGVRAIAIDRPGFGLSDPIERGSEDYREAVVNSVNLILDGLGLTETALLGNSAGGTCALWYALANPNDSTRPARGATLAPRHSCSATDAGCGHAQRRAAAPDASSVDRDRGPEHEHLR